MNRKKIDKKTRRKDRQQKIIKTLKVDGYNSSYQKVYIKKFISKSLY